MEVKLQNEIKRLTAIKDAYKESYISKLENIEEKRDRVIRRLERTTSRLNNELLVNQRDQYDSQIMELDTIIENTIRDIDEKLADIEFIKTEMEERRRQEKESFEFNIEKIREAAKRKNVNDVFAMFENVANALEIIRKERS
jgi:flagellar biosynthesis chaperone FliJ